jgi:putative molybdopterin biosynthesis protein
VSATNDAGREGWLGTNGVAQLLGVHPKHVYRLLKRGLPAHRLGGEWRFDPVEVQDWLRADTERAELPAPPPLIAANGDVCVELLLGLLGKSCPTPVGLVQADRTSGGRFLERGSVLAAGVHGDAASVGAGTVTVHVTRRSVGLAYVKGRKLRSLRGVAGLRLASRAPTAGVRPHLDRALGEAGLDSEALHQQAVLQASHRDVALAVLSGRVDVGLMTAAWAERSGLGCLPIGDEDYALSLRGEALGQPLGQALLRALQSAELGRLLGAAGGYDPSGAGTLR